MVEIMDIKSKLLDAVQPPKPITAAQDLLAKKLLELIPVYFRIIEAYVSTKNDRTGGDHKQAFGDMDERIKKVYSLIKDLNTKFYLCTNELSGISAHDEIINEAEALRDVIDANYSK